MTLKSLQETPGKLKVFTKIKTRKAFSFVEVLIALIITAIIGGAVILTMWLAVNTSFAMSDYTFADAEMENAVQVLARDFGLVGLGMPNNSLKKGSFALSFRDTADSRWPIMAYFGNGEEWGGPVTVAGSTTSYPSGSSGSLKEPALITTGDLEGTYYGPELYYSWAVPTGVRVNAVNIDGDSANWAQNGDTLHLVYLNNVALKDRVSTVRWRGRNAGVPTTVSSASSGKHAREWVTLPILRLPLRVNKWMPDASTPVSIDVTAAPVPWTVISLDRQIMGVDEVHVMQAARLFLRDHELVKVSFGADYTAAATANPNDPSGNNVEEVLARNVVGLQFAHNPADSLLTMYIAVRGNETDPITTGHGTQLTAWPSWLPPINASVVERFRILVKTVTWRIRN